MDAEPLRVVARDVVRADVQPGQHVAAGVNRGVRRAGGAVAAADDVAPLPLTRALRVDGTRERLGLLGAQNLQVREEERLVALDRAADAETVDVLDELAFREAVDVELPLVGVEPRPAAEVEARALETVRPRSRDHGDLAAAVAPVLGGGVAGQHLEFRQRVRVRAQRREVGAAGARLIDVNPVQREVPGAIPGPVHVDAAACVGPRHDAGLRGHERERIAAPRADDGQCLHGLLVDDAAEVPRRAELHQLAAGHYLHALRERAGFERGIEGRRLADANDVSRGHEGLESLDLDLHGVGADLHRFERVRPGVTRHRGEGDARPLAGERNGGARNASARRVRDDTCDAGRGALGPRRRHSRTQGHCQQGRQKTTQPLHEVTLPKQKCGPETRALGDERGTK